MFGQLHGNRGRIQSIAFRRFCLGQRIGTEGYAGKGDLALRAGDCFGNELAGGIRQLEVDASKGLVCLCVGFENGDIADCAGIGDRLAHSLPGVCDFNGDRGGIQNVASRCRCFGQLVGAEGKAGEDELAVRCGVALLDELAGGIRQLEMRSRKGVACIGDGLEDCYTAGLLAVGDLFCYYIAVIH